jgi:hypothetical protein
MKEDPILAEMRALRDEYAAAFGHDPDAIFQDLLRLQAQHPGKLVHFPPRRPPVVREPRPMRSRPGDKAAV